MKLAARVFSTALLSACSTISTFACVATDRPDRSMRADTGNGSDPERDASTPPPTPGSDASTPAPEQDAGTGSTPDAGSPPAPDAAPRMGLAVLGWNSHDVASVRMEVISTPADGLNVPRDLAFNPEHPGELWVVNRADDSTVTYFDVGTAAQRAEKRIDPYALHFMDEVSSIAFGTPGKFATCQESRNTYDDTAPPNDFMGPTLWPSDMNIYAHSNPEAIRDIGVDLGSHLDMLHESPLCMGIAWESANVYWTFDGQVGSISRNDFVQDHGPGYDDHSDGIIQMFAMGSFTREPGVPSHMKRDASTGLLYIADTGASRVVTVDASAAVQVRTLQAKEEGTSFVAMRGEVITVFADAASAGLVHPSGLALIGGHLFVTDNATSRITAFDLTGQRVDWLDTGLPPGSLMGIAASDDDRLYLVSATQDRLLRISAKKN